METFSACRFCNMVEGKFLYSGIDQPFASNGAFIAVASIGAMVEGWSLIIPKEHQCSLRNVYRDSGFADFTVSVISRLVHNYGSLIAFEHGANKEGSITLCGTDHAHLHLVPFQESLLPELQNSNLKWIKSRTSEIASRSGNNEYLFYTELGTNKLWHDPVGYLHILAHPISQFFRHIIAARTGHHDAVDYRQFPNLETARQTRNMIAESFNPKL